MIKITGTKNLRLKLLTKTVYEATIADVFKELFYHDMQYATNLDENLHSSWYTRSKLASANFGVCAKIGAECKSSFYESFANFFSYLTLYV